MLNQCTFIGRLAADPESRFTQSGKQVVNLTLCCDSGYGDNKKTEFVKIVVWDKLAAIVADYLRKGSLAYFQGEQQTRQWEDKDGGKRYTTEIVAREMKILTPKSGGGHAEPTTPPEPSMGDYDSSVPF